MMTKKLQILELGAQGEFFHDNNLGQDSAIAIAEVLNTEDELMCFRDWNKIEA